LPIQSTWANARPARRRPGWLRQVATLGADVIALVVSAITALWAAPALDGAPLVGRLFGAFPGGEAVSIWLMLALTPVWVFALYVFGLYREPGRSIGGAPALEALNGLSALTAGQLAGVHRPRPRDGLGGPVAALIAFWARPSCSCRLARWVSRRHRLGPRGLRERTLIVGAGEVGHTLAAKIAKHPEYRLEVVGFLDDGEPLPTATGPRCRCWARSATSRAIIKREQLDRVIVAFSRARHGAFLRLVRACADHGVKVNIVPRLFEVVSSRAGVDDIEGIPLLDVGHVELSRLNMAVKRAFDLVVGGHRLRARVPLLAAIAVLVKLDSPAPSSSARSAWAAAAHLHDVQVPLDEDGADACATSSPTRTSTRGRCSRSRRTRASRASALRLRRWSLDELPQIFNVLKGEMSLVGPRPLWVEEAKQCRGWTQKRLDITPGITGLWQVLGRSDIPFEEMVKLDYLYVTSWSLGWDIKLLLQTVPAVLDKRGAY
jgi:lipopolysaccharide/colanic/teichoic acid biosynthesis glycosyltransferase